MAKKSDIDLMDFSINFETNGLDEISLKVESFIAAAKAAGMPLDMIRQKVQEVIKLLSAFGSSRVKAKKDTWDDLAKAFNGLRESAAKLKVPKPAADSFQQMEQALRRAAMAYAGFYGALAPYRKIYRFAEGVAEVNKQLLMLSYNSRESMKGLQEIGNTLSVFGGSAKDAASGERRYESLIAEARRGAGLGYLQDQAWKFGFGFDVNESYDDRFQRAIQHYQGLSKQDRIAFAKGEGWTDAQTAVANKGIDWYRRNRAEMSRYGGRKEEAAESATELSEATAKLGASWQDVKDQLMIAIVPLVKTVVGAMRGITDFLGRHRVILRAIAYAATAVGVALSAWSVTKLISQLRQMIALLGVAKAVSLGGKSFSWGGLGAKVGSSIRGAGKFLTGTGGKLFKYGAVAMEGINAVESYAQGNVAEGNKAVGRGLGGWGGMAGGAKLGAMIGTMIAPGIGTAIGGFLGSVGGWLAGTFLGEKVAEGANNLGKFNKRVADATGKVGDVAADFAEASEGLRRAGEAAQARQAEVDRAVVREHSATYSTTYNNISNSTASSRSANATVNVTQNFTGNVDREVVQTAAADIKEQFSNYAYATMG